MRIHDVDVPGDGASGASVRLYEPVGRATPAPALLWIHGGGFLIGDPEQDRRSSIGFARELGITVAAVRYRLAPEHPHRPPSRTAYAALTWLFAQADALGIDPRASPSAGQRRRVGSRRRSRSTHTTAARCAPAFQLLVYPMLDDRTATRGDLPRTGVAHVDAREQRVRAGPPTSGTEPGGDGVSPYAAPARREDLSGLPPAWIGVGTNDLFHDEDVAYAGRLEEAGVPCDLHVVDGAFHGFDAVLPRAGVSRGFWQTQADALRRALVPRRRPSRASRPLRRKDAGRDHRARRPCRRGPARVSRR